ncbi:HEPN domain-containing protein [Nocardia cyriacigeorgica]|uniref:ApeA N-terminal domain 1-containing protein n=1 Tax=Nocardia cyriacigeorgica TaxID=135487 RepID=UPI001895A65F|nr:HEPN domain-containing protein [Nocardia cyriacigeorgica]MBF6479383.1 hypothetical protein [Nocardia cyriacigeorgica]
MSTEQIKIPGTFWSPAEPHLQSSGIVTISRNGDKSSLVVDSRIMTEACVTITHPSEHETHIAYGGTPTDHVADFSPRTLLGLTNDGNKISLLDSQITLSHGLSLEGAPGRQEFSCRTIVLGTHVEKRQKFTSCRYEFAGTWAHHLDGTDYSLDLLGGTILRFKKNESSIILELECTDRALIREFETHILTPYKSLLKIATQQRLRVLSMEIRESAESSWSTVYSTRTGQPEARPQNRPWILPDAAVTIDRIGAWLANSYRADSLVEGLASIEQSGPIETQVITLAAIAEGIHRKLFDHRGSFENLTKEQIREMRNAVIEAGCIKLHEFGETDDEKIKERLGAGLNMFNDKPYRARLSDLVGEASILDPEVSIISAFSDWGKSVQEVRNKLVHQLPFVKGKKKRPLDGEELRNAKEQLFDLEIAVSYSLTWILQLVLLARAGFRPEDLSQDVREFEVYEYACANIDSLLMD